MTRLRLQSILLPALAWVCSSSLIFRRSLRTGFDILPGDELDSRLILRIQEHWFRFFSGKADWLDLGMFYPTPNSLGFSDTTFLRIRIDCPDAKAPAEVYNSSDQRTLGLGVIEMKLESL